MIKTEEDPNPLPNSMKNSKLYCFLENLCELINFNNHIFLRKTLKANLKQEMKLDLNPKFMRINVSLNLCGLISATHTQLKTPSHIYHSRLLV